MACADSLSPPPSLRQFVLFRNSARSTEAGKAAPARLADAVADDPRRRRAILAHCEVQLTPILEQGAAAPR